MTDAAALRIKLAVAAGQLRLLMDEGQPGKPLAGIVDLAALERQHNAVMAALNTLPLSRMEGAGV